MFSAPLVSSVLFNYTRWARERKTCASVVCVQLHRCVYGWGIKLMSLSESLLVHWGIYSAYVLYTSAAQSHGWLLFLISLSRSLARSLCNCCAFSPLVKHFTRSPRFRKWKCLFLINSVSSQSMQQPHYLGNRLIFFFSCGFKPNPHQNRYISFYNISLYAEATGAECTCKLSVCWCLCILFQYRFSVGLIMGPDSLLPTKVSKRSVIRCLWRWFG